VRKELQENKMKDRKATGDASEVLPDATRSRLDQLRRRLLHLHKILLDSERAVYEREHGRKSATEVLQLLINHEQFAWLHRISEVVVRIDEILEYEEPSAVTNAALLLTELRSLLLPTEEGEGFGRKYHEALQRQPEAVLAHKDVMAVLSDG
jgi:hypothetical protein